MPMNTMFVMSGVPESRASRRACTTWSTISAVDRFRTSPIFAEAVRIDHHNNYGGLYTDGLSGNDWRDGEGSRKDNWPYCATGDKYAWDQGECDETNVTFKPWFWGHPECQAVAFEMMKAGRVGDRYYIGNSGPRDRRSCRESERLMKARATVRYRYNLPDKDCIHRVIFRFRDLNDKQSDTLTIEGTTANDEKCAGIDRRVKGPQSKNWGTFFAFGDDVRVGP